MGKRYASELAQLEATCAWATDVDISPVLEAVRSAGPLPLVAIGSGGSLSAAHLLAGIHRRYTGRIASVVTPLEAVTDRLDPHVSAWLLSAGGSNVDILAAFAALVYREPKQLAVMCSRPNSPLTEKARQHPYVDLLEFVVPGGKDGFLATNSLVAFAVLIARGYLTEFGSDSSDTGLLKAGVAEKIFNSAALTRWRSATDALWSRDTTVVLHGSSTKVGAIDLESKFTEAALGNLQIADYRNFAHGRHHWLAKRGQSSGILAFTAPDDRDIAEKTLALIPKHVPIARIDLDGGYIEAALTALVLSVQITGWAGAARDIDPGRPGVPEFGRRLYNLSLPRVAKASGPVTLSASDVVAIERKAGLSIDRLVKRGDLLPWRDALKVFKKALRSAIFGAVVLDYDGTVVDTRARFVPPKHDVVEELVRLLEAGLFVGIATGRGASVRRDLQSSLPRSLWRRVIVGYYNGGDLGALCDDRCPDGSAEPGKALAELAHALRRHSELAEIATQTDRLHQITLEPRRPVPENRLWDIANQIIQLRGHHDIEVVRSSHSIDILAPGVSKESVLTRVADRLGGASQRQILKIGDRGRWPGNDFALLREPLSLSVDELSVDPATCWNLAPRGQRGVEATLQYCRALRVDGAAGARFSI
jgi:hydroxymethylpyrimidine pyrophosphatase-like HAD family hydrolase